MWGEDTGFFVHEDAQVGGEAQLCGHATRGSAPSAALGRLEDGAPASRDRLRCRLVAQGLLPRKLPRHTNPSANS